MALIRRAVILGGCSAGWMTGAAPAKSIGKLHLAMAHAAQGLPTHRATIERHGPALYSL